MSKGFKVHTGESNGHSPGPYMGELKLAQVNVNDEASLEKWGTILHLERHELLNAIKCFGPVVRDIRVGLLHNRDEAA